MNTLKQLIMLTIVFINLGGMARYGYCFIQIIFNGEELNSYKKKMIHLGIFLILANCILDISAVIMKYME